jgi:hypothetical protein
MSDDAEMTRIERAENMRIAREIMDTMRRADGITMRPNAYTTVFAVLTNWANDATHTLMFKPLDDEDPVGDAMMREQVSRDVNDVNAVIAAMRPIVDAIYDEVNRKAGR